VELHGQDLSCYSIKIEAVGFKENVGTIMNLLTKCIPVTNIFWSFAYNMAAKTS